VGWLLDVAVNTDPALKNASAIARRVRSVVEAAGGWRGHEISESNLGNMVRKLDKREQVVWWQDTGEEARRALARVIGLDDADLLLAIRRPGGEERLGPTMWDFEMFPNLRPLDLASESPFPGVPEELIRWGGPESNRTWWVAPPGAGKTLVGRWLEVRHHWEVRAAPDWSSLLRDLSRLPPSARVYFELQDAAGATEIDREVFPGRICIASADARGIERPTSASSTQDSLHQWLVAHATRLDDIPYTEADRQPDTGGTTKGEGQPASTQTHFADAEGTTLVRTDAPSSWLSPLFEWSISRLEAPGRLRAADVRRLLRDQRDVLESWFSTPGDALSWLGILAAVGSDKLLDEEGDQQELMDASVRAFFATVVSRPDLDITPDTARQIRKQAAELLTGALVRAIREDLTFDLDDATWKQLLGPRSEPTPLPEDVAAIALSDGDPADILARIRAAVLSPRTLVDALRSVGVFIQDGPTVRVRPPWLHVYLLQRAKRHLLSDGHTGIGALVLHPALVEQTLFELTVDLVEGRLEALQEWLKVTPTHTTEWLASVDGMVRATGLALAHGADLPTTLVKRVWERQSSLLGRAFRGSPKTPLLTVTQVSHEPGLDQLGCWYLAVFAISRALADSEDCGLPRALDLWRVDPEDLTKEEYSERTSALEQASYAFASRRPDVETLFRDGACHRLGGRLFAERGPALDKVTAIQAPFALVLLATTMKDAPLTPDQYDDVLRLSFGMESLRYACEKLRADLKQVLAWCWTQWLEGPKADPHRVLPLRTWGSPQLSPADLRVTWGALPENGLPDHLFEFLAKNPSLWPYLPPHAWDAALRVWGRITTSRPLDHSNAPYDVIPVGVLVRAMELGLLNWTDSDSARSLWQRSPAAAFALMDAWASNSPAADDTRLLTLRDLASEAPAEQQDAVLDKAVQWLMQPEQHPGAPASWVLPWLQRIVHRRGAGWRRALRIFLEANEGRLGATTGEGR